MASPFVPQAIVGWELLMVLGVGAATIVGLAAATGRWLVSAAWRAAIWRIATIPASGDGGYRGWPGTGAVGGAMLTEHRSGERGAGK
jgi:hypothetical protein